MADTGINKEQWTKRQHYEDPDTCGALMKAGLLTNDCRAILCRFLHPSALTKKRKKKGTREMQQQQRLISSKDFAEPAQSHFCEGR